MHHVCNSQVIESEIHVIIQCTACNDLKGVIIIYRRRAKIYGNKMVRFLSPPPSILGGSSLFTEGLEIFMEIRWYDFCHPHPLS